MKIIFFFAKCFRPFWDLSPPIRLFSFDWPIEPFYNLPISQIETLSTRSEAFLDLIVHVAVHIWIYVHVMLTFFTQKIKLYIKDLFRNLQIWSHLLSISLKENFSFCSVIWRLYNDYKVQNYKVKCIWR